MIPKQFKLAGMTVVVKPVKEEISTTSPMGIAHYHKNQIDVLVHPTIPEEVSEQTFFHELTHFILYCMGRSKLMSDEGFVDGFAHYLYQYLKTCEGNYLDSDVGNRQQEVVGVQTVPTNEHRSVQQSDQSVHPRFDFTESAGAEPD